ncbi:MAG: hypothetical protein IT384_18190 [Deltaproteobacteria bacterium]|nr:hypothetical protein [Deltaproteobacteria bacterium]
MLCRFSAWPTALALLLLARPAEATVLADWSLDQVAARADLIVIGVVESKRTLAGEMLMTESVFRVERTLAGAATDRIVLSQLGGRQGDRVVEIVGDAELAIGGRFVLFTRVHADGRRYLVGMALGAYALEGERATQRIDAPLIDARGVVTPAPGVRSLPLEGLIEAIARSRR